MDYLPHEKKWNQHFRCPICSGNNNITNRKRSFRLPDLAEGRLTKQLLTMIPKYSIISFFFCTIQMGSEKKCQMRMPPPSTSGRSLTERYKNKNGRLLVPYLAEKKRTCK